MGTPIFDPGFGKNRKFYVQNDILKIFYMTFKRQIQIKRLKMAVELCYVQTPGFRFPLFVFLWKRRNLG